MSSSDNAPNNTNLLHFTNRETQCMITELTFMKETQPLSYYIAKGIQEGLKNQLEFVSKCHK